MKNINFPTDNQSIQERLESINPIEYEKTRNLTNGAVTYLSPYITHGYLTLPEIRLSILSKYDKNSCKKILQELAWREYFQRVYEKAGDAIWQDMRNPQINLKIKSGMPKVFIDKNTDIKAIDKAIVILENNGYMHNHARMWTSMLATNIYKFYWKDVSKWMYYHLLDGDLASNTLSWQWVAGTFSSKVYVANQENINKYDKNNAEYKTYLDTEYENLENLNLSEKYLEIVNIDNILMPNYPKEFISNEELNYLIKNTENIFIYHMWNLSPSYTNKYLSEIESGKKVNILLIEKSHLDKYPISEKRLEFIINLSKNILNLKIVFIDSADFIGKVSETNPQINLVTTFHQNISHFENTAKNANINLEVNKLPYLIPDRPWKSGGFMSWYNN